MALQVKQWSDHALSTKAEGNKLFAAKQYPDAIKRYSEAIEEWMDTVICDETWWRRSTDAATAAFFDVLAQLLNNRAACHMKLGNMKAVVKDTAAAIHLCTVLKLIQNPASTHSEKGLRPTPECVDTYCKAMARRARALEAMGNTAAVTPMLADAIDSCKQRLPQEWLLDHMTAQQRCHPCLNFAWRKLDWSLITVGKWTCRKATGTLPTPVHGFAAALYAGQIYVVGGEGSLTTGLEGNLDKTYALKLSTMEWRRVAARGGLHDRLPHQAAVNLHATAVWRTSICCLVPNHQSLHLFDMATETWSRRKAPNAIKGVTTLWGASGNGNFSDFAIAVWGDTLYVHGGQSRVSRISTTKGQLLAHDLLTSTWKVLHHEDNGRLSRERPEARHAHQMWALGGKLYIFGGRTPGEQMMTDDKMIGSSDYFWSFDLATSTWRNESCFMNRGNFTNMPAARTEFSAATFGGNKALVFGGYATDITHRTLDNLYMHKFSYLADTFVWDSKTNTWKYVHVEQWPDYRASAALVFIPVNGDELNNSKQQAGKAGGGSGGVGGGVLPQDRLGGSTPAISNTNGSSINSSSGMPGSSGAIGGSSDVDGSSSNSSSKKLMAGKILMLGGYLGGHECRGMAFDQVWELTLTRGLKHVETQCWGCGRVSAGLKLCGGTCGGAVAVCGRECQAKVWQDHKHWCSRVDE